jgi:hypothetical protein
MQDYFWEQGWTDGLPVVPPTEDAVRAMLAAVDADPQHSLGVIQPSNSRATLEKLAINAVMAGCKPEHFPVVVTAVRAALHDGYNLAGTAATTGGANQVVIVNGPIAPRLGIQADAGCFGPGFRANAAIGRALRLIVRNVAGLTPGEMDKATLSSPGRYSFCFAENLETSPWPSLAESKGFHPDVSTVTMVAANAPLQLEAHGDREPEGFLTAAAHAILGLGPSLSELVLVISQELIAYLAASGWSRAQVAGFLYEKTLRPAGEWDQWRRIDKLPPDADRERLIGSVSSPDRITVVPAGGDAGEFMSIITSWGSSRSVTREIAVPRQEVDRA